MSSISNHTLRDNGELILDGPNELIARRLNNIYENTDRAELKKNYFENFKIQLAKTLKIDEKMALELINGLDKSALEILEKRVTSRCIKNTWLERIAWLFILGFLSKTLALVIVPALVYYSVKDVIAVITFVLCVCFFILCLRPVLGLSYIFKCLAGRKRYMNQRRLLRKIYGKKYFLLTGLSVFAEDHKKLNC